MSRWLSWLSELQPALFAEISPALAAEQGIDNGEWVTISTSRAEIEARALVTERMQPMRVNGQKVDVIGLPYHWGPRGLVTGDAVNDLVGVVLDPTVKIHEAKSFTCNLRKGRKRADAPPTEETTHAALVEGGTIGRSKSEGAQMREHAPLAES
jgi:formate dehydrogenase major subunit